MSHEENGNNAEKFRVWKPKQQKIDLFQNKTFQDKWEEFAENKMQFSIINIPSTFNIKKCFKVDQYGNQIFHSHYVEHANETFWT